VSRGYTSIRVRVEDKKRIEKLARMLGLSLSETIHYMVDFIEKNISVEDIDDRIKTVFKALEKARDIGETDSSHIDEYLYG